MSKHPSYFALVLSMLVVGCSGESTSASSSGSNAKSEPPDSPPTAPPTQTAKPVDPPPPDLDPGEKGKEVSDALAAKLVGTYAMRLSVATVQNVPVLGKQPSTSHGFAVVTIARDGDGLSMTERACHVDIVGSGSVTTTVPDAIAASITAAPHELRAWEESGKVKWARPLVVVPVGVKLANPAKDALPTNASDSRIWDQDGDGQPGVTVKVAGFASGDIFVVQRQANALGGDLDPSGGLSGLVADSSQQAVIGATNPLLNQNVASTLDPDRSKSKVVLVKDTSSLTCPDLMTRRATLFAGK